MSLDEGQTIHGFGPSNTDNLTDAEFFKAVRNRESFPGVVTDDTDVFNKAIEG